MTYKAVIFDLDGTLVNSIKDIADAMNVVLQKRNYPTYDYDTYKTFVGSGVKSLVVKALPQNKTNETEVNTCLSDMMQVYSACCTNKTAPYQGILKLLDTLHAKGLKLAILSNKEDGLTKKVATALLPKYIQPVLGLKEEALKKPNPKVLLQLCETLNVKPNEAIYIGDTDVDILVAKNANTLAVGVSWGFRDPQELIAQGADYMLQTPEDLLELVC
jgi:phosphoglycolate phosphatase